jgi:hypothetical protein
LATPSDAATRAACDLEEWGREVAAALPAAEVRVDTTAIAGTAATLGVITIRWEAPGPYDQEYELRLQAP